MSSITIKDLSFSYGKQDVLKNINLEIEDGKFHSLLGLSGCGKTTLLRIIAGFLTPSKGQVLLDGQDITNLVPEKRNMGVVFQNYALFLHMTVEQNVAYGLKVNHASKSEIDTKVKEYLDLVNMTEFAKKSVRDLSGGQQQRVALARALARGVNVLLLDEPMSNLDPELREKMRAELRKIQKQIGITTLLITHEQSEALSISDNISVMNNGIIEQTGAPHEIYEHPKTEFVRSFIGELNELAEGSGLEGLHTMEADGKFYVRPEHLALFKEAGEGRVEGEVTYVKYLGSSLEYQIKVGNTELKVLMLKRPTSSFFYVGDKAFVGRA